MRPVLYKAPPPAPAIYNWTGCYVGIQGGGGVLYDGLTLENGGGALAGGQLGCNRQIGQFVLGVEAEGWWSGLQSTFNLSGGGFVTELLATNNRWDADVAVRAGIAVDNVLIYGKVARLEASILHSMSLHLLLETPAVL